MTIPTQSNIGFAKATFNVSNNRFEYNLSLSNAIIPGSRIISWIGISGPGRGLNAITIAGGNGSYNLTEIAGLEDDVNSVSVDSMYIDIPIGLTLPINITFIANDTLSTDTNYIGGWVGQYNNLDQTGYGFQGHSYDRNFGNTGTSNNPVCNNAGNTNDFPLEVLLYGVFGKSPVNINSQSARSLGYASDGLNGFFAMQEKDVTSEAVYNNQWIMNGPTYWNVFFTGFKALSFPSQSNNTLMTLGLGN